jgi:hypothetical protein
MSTTSSSTTSTVKASTSVSNKWEPLNFKTTNDYTTKNISNRWEDQRDSWLTVLLLSFLITAK